MLSKFACDLRFHEVLQTTIIRQVTKENDEIETIKKYRLYFSIFSISSFFFRYLPDDCCL